MGLVSNVFLRDDGSSAGVTYMSGALVRTGQNFAASLLGRRDRIKPGYGLLWRCLLGGAILGTWLQTIPGAIGPSVAAGANALSCCSPGEPRNGRADGRGSRAARLVPTSQSAAIASA